jgi:MFS family permease
MTEKKFIKEAERKEMRFSLGAMIFSTLLLRIASRTSFVILSVYLSAIHSATLVVVVLEAFYISELVIAPIIGSLSDRIGRKPFLIGASLLGAAGAVVFMIGSRLFPNPIVEPFDGRAITLLLLILAGRLLEGAATGINAPASLGYITDTTIGAEKLRNRVMTAFEVVTVGGLALAIPFGGQINKYLGTWGFLAVVGLHALTILTVLFFLKERVAHEHTEGHGSLFESLTLLRQKTIFTFLPAWLSINALVGGWITLCTLILSYKNPDADLRHPGQLLYGGFSPEFATLMLGLFGLIFLAGMGAWMPFLSRLRRTSTMLIGLGGLAVSVIALTVINGLAENPESITPEVRLIIGGLLVLFSLGILLLSGFTPAALTQMATIAETQEGKRGAVMGLYSVVLAIGQLLGAFIGGLFVDWAGFFGLMIFSAILGILALISVWYMRSHRQDLLPNHSK